MNTKLNRNWILALLSLLGVGVSAWQSQHFYAIRSGTSGFTSFCNRGAAFNCDLVTGSSYSEFFAGIPLSNFAAGWYLAIFFAALILYNPFWRREALRLTLVLTGVAIVFSAIYFTIMAMVLKTYCLFCLVVDAINVLNFGIVLSMKPEGFSIHKPDRAKWKTLLGISAASLLVGVLGLRSLDGQQLEESSANAMANSIIATAPLSVNAGPEFPSIGPKDAPITIVEFSDFQCPYCKFGAMNLATLQTRFPDQIRVVFRNYPLDPSCNPKVQHSMHPVACEAAKVGWCANRLGKFKELYEGLFENQSHMAPGFAEQFAVAHGIDKEQLSACLKDPDVGIAISRDIEEGTQLGIESTPTFFVNGHEVKGVMPPQVWVKIIDQLKK